MQNVIPDQDNPDPLLSFPLKDEGAFKLKTRKHNYAERGS